MVIINQKPYHMIYTHSFVDQDLSITQPNFPSQQELILSPKLSVSSIKDHSVTKTKCSHSTTTKIATDSEDDSEQGQEEQCENYNSGGSCMRGANCSFGHFNAVFGNRRGFRSALLMNFPQLLVVCGRRSSSFLE